MRPSQRDKVTRTSLPDEKEIVINKSTSYGDIFKWFSKKHGDTSETRAIHARWKKIAAGVYR